MFFGKLLCTSKTSDAMLAICVGTPLEVQKDIETVTSSSTSK